MPALGDQLPVVRQPLSPEVLEQRENLEAIMGGLALRMQVLAPEPAERHWYSSNGVVVKGPAAVYIPSDNPTLETKAWLETTHWRKGYGPSLGRKQGNQVVYSLWSQSTAVEGTLRGKKGRSQERVSALAGRLSIHQNELMRVNPLGLPYDATLTLLNTIDETLDLVAQA